MLIPLLAVSFMTMLCVRGQFLGPSDVQIDRVEKCAEDQLGAKLDIKFKKVNRTHSGIDAYVVAPFDIGESVHTNVTAAKWGDGGWKEHAFDMYQTNACEFIKKHSERQLFEVLRKVGCPQKCPMTAGTYELKNHVFDTDIKTPLMYGKFKVDIHLMKETEYFTCIRMLLQITPKNTFGR